MGARSGEACPCGQGKFAVASSVRCGDKQVRYLRCASCGRTDKHVLPAAEVRNGGHRPRAQ